MALLHRGDDHARPGLAISKEQRERIYDSKAEATFATADAGASVEKMRQFVVHAMSAPRAICAFALAQSFTVSLYARASAAALVESTRAAYADRQSSWYTVTPR
jgi:hypothetical protein